MKRRAFKLDDFYSAANQKDLDILAQNGCTILLNISRACRVNCAAFFFMFSSWMGRLPSSGSGLTSEFPRMIKRLLFDSQLLGSHRKKNVAVKESSGQLEEWTPHIFIFAKLQWLCSSFCVPYKPADLNKIFAFILEYFGGLELLGLGSWACMRGILVL